MVALLRLSPLLPFNLQNYFYGITDLKLLEYVAATFFGIMPGTLLYVYLGAAGKAASGEGVSTLKWGFFAAGLGATVIRGDARFLGSRELVVSGQIGEQRISARRVIIATGSSPALPKIDGLASVPHFTNETA